MEDALTLVLYLVIAAIVGIVTLVRKVMENTRAGEDGKKVNLAEAVQEQMNRYLKGGPPGRFGGRGLGEGEQKPSPPTPPVRPSRPPLLEKAAPVPPKPPPGPPLQRAGRRIEQAGQRVEQAEREVAQAERRVQRAGRKPTALQVPTDLDKNRSLVNQSSGPEKVDRQSSQRKQHRAAFTRKNLRKAVLLAEILGPPVAEREDYRLF